MKEISMSKFDDHIEYFTTRMLALHRSSPLYFTFSTIFHNIAKDQLDTFHNKHIKNKRSIKHGIIKEFYDLKSAYDDTGATMVIMPESFFVSLVSIYDFLISSCVREICVLKPDLLKSSEKSINFPQILKYNSLEDLQKYCLEETTESVMRQSHTEHIEWLEDKSNTRLRPNEETWQKFVECTQRRHLYVHTGGLVSEPYLRNCRAHKVKLPKDCTVGTRLSADAIYCESSFSTLFTMGALITHVLWRKYAPEESEAADKSLNQLAFSLIDYAQYDLAITLLEFALNDIKKYSSEQTRLMFVVNLAQSYKWSGNDAKCAELLQNLDPTGLPVEYKSAYFTLSEEYEAAITHIRSALKISSINRHDIEQWPIYKQLRTTKEFADFYEKRYRTTWSPPDDDSDKTPFERLMPKLKAQRDNSEQSKKPRSKKRTTKKKPSRK